MGITFTHAFYRLIDRRGRFELVPIGRVATIALVNEASPTIHINVAIVREDYMAQDGPD
jgi:hypothetical protein